MSYDIGHKFWIVKYKWAEPEKKVDENGVIWQKVNQRNREYYIVDAEIIGKITMEIEGYSLWDDEPYYNKYAIQTSEGYKDSIPEDFLDADADAWTDDMYFHSKEEAEEFLESVNQ